MSHPNDPTPFEAAMTNVLLGLLLFDLGAIICMLLVGGR